MVAHAARSRTQFLVDRAIAASPTLEIALDRLQQARAQEFVVIGSALPALGGSEGGGIGSGSDLGRGRASQTLVSAENGAGMSQINNLVGFEAAWEIDVFGKYRRAIEAAEYDVEAAIAARNVVLISLVADVTRAYLDLRALQMRLAVLRKQIEVVQKYLNFVQERFSRGITNELDVTLAQRQLAQLQSEVDPLIAQINAARYVIAVLIGEFPESLGQELKRPGTIPALPGRIRSGLPIDLLRRRPTLPKRNANWRAPMPSSASRPQTSFPKWRSPPRTVRNKDPASPGPINPIWSVGPALAAPLLDFGRLDALWRRPTIAAREMLLNYKQTVLNAVREVDTAIDASGATGSVAPSCRCTEGGAARGDAGDRAVRSGTDDLLNVIDAQRQEFAIEQQYVTAQQSAAEQLVTLYKSLGGGWEDYQIFPPIPLPVPAVAAAFKSLLER